VTVLVESDRPLEVRYRGKSWRAPVPIAVPRGGPSATVLLVDSRSGASVKLLVGGS